MLTTLFEKSIFGSKEEKTSKPAILCFEKTFSMPILYNN